jgi:hypothetical protein
MWARVSNFDDAWRRGSFLERLYKRVAKEEEEICISSIEGARPFVADAMLRGPARVLSDVRHTLTSRMTRNLDGPRTCKDAP